MLREYFTITHIIPCIAGTSWRESTVHGQARHRVLILLGRSKIPIFNWIGVWVRCMQWAVHQLPTSKLLGVSCRPQSISSSEGCSCTRVQSIFVCYAEKLEASTEAVIRESSWSDLLKEIFHFSSCTLTFLDQIFVLLQVFFFLSFFLSFWSWLVQGSPP